MVNHASFSPSKPTVSSRVRRERDEENAGVETPSKKRKNSIPEASPDVAEPITQERGEDGNDAAKVKLQENAEIVNDRNAPSVDPSSPPAATPEVAASRPEPPVREVYRTPSYAAWFHWGKIHPLERLSEFFDKRSAARTPRIYINKYRENPKQALTCFEVRRMLVGDVHSLSRVFDFLEHWGLINHQVAAAWSEAPSPSPTGIDSSYPSGVHVVSMPAVKIPGISTFESSGHSVAASHANKILATHKNVFVFANKKFGPGSTKPEVEVRCCHSCKKDSSKQRFYRKQAVLSGNIMVSNGGVASVSTSGAALQHAGAGADTVTDAHDLVSPFTDTSHPLFAQVNT